MHQKEVTILVAQKSKVDTLLAHDPHYFDAFTTGSTAQSAGGFSNWLNKALLPQSWFKR